MMTYQLITALSDVKPHGHLIARSSSTLLPDTPLIAEMRGQDAVADTRFGCAPLRA